MSQIDLIKKKNPHFRQGLQIKFHEVPSSGMDFVFTPISGELNGLLFDILGDFPVYEARIHIEPTDENVQVNGHISGELRLTCSRCAEEFNSRFSKSFVTLFYRSEHNIKTLGLDSHDIDGSFDLEFLEGDSINLGEIIHEQIALEMPFKPLCTDTCRGLCQICGTNLNSGQCECKQTEVMKPATVRKSPFEQLKVLRGE